MTEMGFGQCGVATSADAGAPHGLRDRALSTCSDVVAGLRLRSPLLDVALRQDLLLLAG